jgi:hypothetical protein
LEEAAKFKFSVNLKTAKALRVEIPQMLPIRASEVLRWDGMVDLPVRPLADV